MLKKKYRLIITRGQKYIKPSRTYKTSHFKLYTFLNLLSYNRYGCIVSKKIDKRAVVRNRVKREFYQCIKEAKNIKQGLDMLFLVHKNVLSITKEQLCQEMYMLFEKEKIVV